MPLLTSYPSAYLGDSVYIEATALTGEVVMYTNNGAGRDNEIFFEPEVLTALVRFLITYDIIKKENL